MGVTIASDSEYGVGSSSDGVLIEPGDTGSESGSDAFHDYYYRQEGSDVTFTNDDLGYGAWA